LINIKENGLEQRLCVSLFQKINSFHSHYASIEEMDRFDNWLLFRCCLVDQTVFGN